MNKCCFVIFKMIFMMGLVACEKKSDDLPVPYNFDPASIKSVEIKTATNYVNADGFSRLPLYYEVLDYANQPVPYFPYNAIELYANGDLLTDKKYFSTNQAGTVLLEARMGQAKSAVYKIHARKAEEYPLVRLPLIFHIPGDIDSAKVAEHISDNEIIKLLNDTYRNRLDSLEPNRADSFIEFYLSEEAPDGRKLSQPGINHLDFNSPDTRELAERKADSLVHEWCVKEYINVFVGINYMKGLIEEGFSYSFRPEYKTGTYENGFTCSSFENQHQIIPAINLYNEYHFSALAHELGHFLGLYHTFDPFGPTCNYWDKTFYNQVPVRLQDLPKHKKAEPERGGYKFTCDGVLFYSRNVMDYYVPCLSFTQDQVAVMRNILLHPDYLPY